MCENLSLYISNEIIRYLNDRDDVIKDYEAKLRLYTDFCTIDECTVCKKQYGVRPKTLSISDMYDEMYDYDIPFEKCYTCDLIVCNDCEYPWHEGNPWFGIPPRYITNDDYTCIECGKRR